MGNCLIIQGKLVQVMKMDGKVLEYKTPLKVQQVLSEFTGHAISDTLPVHRHLGPDTDMLGGHMYYLLPPPLPSKEIDNTKEEPGKATGIVRIKIVVTKQELKAMLAKGVLSVDDMVSQLQNKHSVDSKSSNRNCGVWKPVLQSIPE